MSAIFRAYVLRCKQLTVCCCVCVLLNSFLMFVVEQEKKNEALYLREHREELIEELAKTIVQKVRNKVIDIAL